MGPSVAKCCECESQKKNSFSTADSGPSEESFYMSGIFQPSSYINMNEKRKRSVRRLSHLPITPKNIIPNIKGSPYLIYDSIATVGRGAYGKVVKARHKKTAQIRAIKIISKKQINNNYTVEEIQNEIEVLKGLAHPNIIKLYEVYNDAENYYLVSEFCTEGELLKYVETFRRFPEIIVKKLMFKIFTAISYLHFNGVIHGDIKLENVMIDRTCDKEGPKSRRNSSDHSSVNTPLSNNAYVTSEQSEQDINSKSPITPDKNKSCDSISDIEQTDTFQEILKNDIENLSAKAENVEQVPQINDDSPPSEEEIRLIQNLFNFDVKLIDFGCSKLFNTKGCLFQDRIGTIIYSAPEVLNQKYDEKCDIWSCGVLLYILLSGGLPFTGVTEQEIFEKIIKGRYCFSSKTFKNISFEAKDLIRKCLIYDPSKRISAKDALNHPFLKNELKLLYDPNIVSIENFEEKEKEIFSSLIQFSHKSKFYQAVLTFLTHNFIKKESVMVLKNIFLSIDTDLDGKLSCQELKQIFIRLGIEISEKEVSDIMKRVDFDDDGYIDYSEFLQATANVRELFTEENLRYAFNLFDTQSDGTVSVKELEEILGLSQSSNSEVVNELLKEINKTEDDEFTFDEFKMMMLQFVDLNSKCDSKTF
ncbi:MAG: protein kinase [archaeon]|nr:protein kinase [archaeon]